MFSYLAVFAFVFATLQVFNQRYCLLKATFWPFYIIYGIYEMTYFLVSDLKEKADEEVHRDREQL